MEPPATEEKLRCITPLPDDKDHFHYTVSSDEESLPVHMMHDPNDEYDEDYDSRAENDWRLSPMINEQSTDEESLPVHMMRNPNDEDGEDYDSHAENDRRLSPMTNSEDDRSAYFRTVEISSTSSTSSRYPHSQGDSSSIINSTPIRHSNSNSLESIVVTDEESDIYIRCKAALKDPVPGYLKPRFSQRPPSPTDSQHSSYHTISHSPKRIAYEGNVGLNSTESSPRPISRTASFKSFRKSEQESPARPNPRPPPSPMSSTLTNNNRKQMLHRRSVSSNIPMGEYHRHSSQRDRKLPIGAYSPSSALVKNRRSKAKSTTHRRTVSFPDHNIAMQSDDPALFSLIGATTGERVCISSDVDPRLMHVSQTVPGEFTCAKGRVSTIDRSILDENIANQDTVKKRNRKPFRRSRSASRKIPEKAVTIPLHHSLESTHVTKQSDPEEVTQSITKEKSTATTRKKSKTNFGGIIEMRNSKKLHDDKKQEESDDLKPKHIESIVEGKKKIRKFLRSFLSKRRL